MHVSQPLAKRYEMTNVWGDHVEIVGWLAVGCGVCSVCGVGCQLVAVTLVVGGLTSIEPPN